jgi:hypothetical protein
MDGLLNKAKSAMSGSSSGQQPAAGGQPGAAPGAPAAGQKDYGDKGIYTSRRLMLRWSRDTQVLTGFDSICCWLKEVRPQHQRPTE